MCPLLYEVDLSPAQTDGQKHETENSSVFHFFRVFLAPNAHDPLLADKTSDKNVSETSHQRHWLREIASWPRVM